MNIVESTYAVNRATLSAAVEATPRLLYADCSQISGNLEPDVLLHNLSREGWQVAGISGFSSVMTDWRLDRLRELSARVRTHDVVHVRCSSSRQVIGQALPLVILAKFYGRKTLLQLCSADVEELLERHRKWLLPLLKLVDRVVVGSRYLQRVLSRSHLPVVALTEPVQLETVEHRTISSLQPRILVNAPLKQNHNVVGAVRAFRLVKQKYPRAELVLAGEGSQRKALEDLADSHRLGGIEFVRPSGSSWVSRVYRECDLYLNPSLQDESPSSLVLAWASGLPAVTTDADGMLHMVRHGLNALVVPVGNHVGLANAVIELIENPELTERLSHRGRQEAGKYTWSRLRQDWVNLYRGLLS